MLIEIEKNHKNIVCVGCNYGYYPYRCHFFPLIGGKLEILDPVTYNAMIYMSIMCGALLIVLGSYMAWGIRKIEQYPILTTTIRITAFILLVNGASAIYFMPNNPFA